MKQKLQDALDLLVFGLGAAMVGVNAATADPMGFLWLFILLGCGVSVLLNHQHWFSK